MRQHGPSGGATHGPQLPRRIAHFDLDTFFVAVARLDDPTLVGRPVLVGHDGARGVVSSASYEARTFGCRSAMPMAEAKRRCPQAVIVPPRFDRYAPISRAFHQVLRDTAPLVDSVGIDEAYADLTGLPDAYAAAAHVRRRVRDELGIAVSVCVAGSRVTAKVGSDRAKPDGLIEVPVGEDAAFLAPLPLRELPMVGPRIGEQLLALGMHTIGDLAALDARWLEHRFGAAGAALSTRARGIDDEPVHGEQRTAKSISRETTFAADVTDHAELLRVLRDQADLVGGELRAIERRARTVTLKVRWPDFTTLTRSVTLDRATYGTVQLFEAAGALLDEVFRTAGEYPVRLIGLGSTNLIEDAVQMGLDEARGDGPARDERADRAVDEIRRRFGASAVQRGPASSRRRGPRDDA